MRSDKCRHLRFRGRCSEDTTRTGLNIIYEGWILNKIPSNSCIISSVSKQSTICRKATNGVTMCCSLGSVLLLMIPCVDKMTIAVDTPINLRPSSVQARTGPQVLIQLHVCMDQIALFRWYFVDLGSTRYRARCLGSCHFSTSVVLEVIGWKDSL